MTSLSRSATRAQETGFVLVTMLWILAALASLASIYSSYTVNTAAASRVADDRVQAEASIRAGVEMAVFRQLALPEKARPARGGFDLRVGRAGVAVHFRSEAARIDLNAAPPDLLAGLFTAVGVNSSRAETFAERIVGWRTKARASRGRKARTRTHRGPTPRMLRAPCSKCPAEHGRYECSGGQSRFKCPAGRGRYECSGRRPR